MASILKVDELRGIVSAGDITVTSEGGAATQSLQQGLAKAWCNIDDAGLTGARDSLNISSYTSEATAIFSVSYSNNLSNDDYVTATGIRDGSGENDTRMVVGSTSGGFYTTSSQRNYTGYHSAATSALMSLNDAEVVMLQVTGDLA